MHLRSLDQREVRPHVSDLTTWDAAAGTRLWDVLPVVDVPADDLARVAALLDTWGERRAAGELAHVRGVAVATDRLDDVAALMGGNQVPAYVHVSGSAASRSTLARCRELCAERDVAVMVDAADVDLRLVAGAEAGPLLVRRRPRHDEELAAAARDGLLVLCVDLSLPDDTVVDVIRSAGPERVAAVFDRTDAWDTGDLPALGGWELPASSGVAAATTRLRGAGFAEDAVDSVLRGTAERVLALTGRKLAVA